MLVSSDITQDISIPSDQQAAWVDYKYQEVIRFIADWGGIYVFLFVIFFAMNYITTYSSRRKFVKK